MVRGVSSKHGSSRGDFPDVEIVVDMIPIGVILNNTNWYYVGVNNGQSDDAQARGSGESMNVGPQGAFRALADPTRRSILMLLSARDRSIGEVAAQFEVTRGAIQKHLSVLEDGSLISVKTVGRERINHLEPDAMKAVSEWLAYFDQFWDKRLVKLKQAIENEKEKN